MSINGQGTFRELSFEHRMLQDFAEDGLDVSEELAKLEGAIQQKSRGIVHVITELEAKEAACDAEAKRLSARAKAAGNAAERLREYVIRTMEENGVDRIDTPELTLAVVENNAAVEITDLSELPRKLIKIKPAEETADKAAILKLYKATGEIPAGCAITRGRRLSIK